MYRVYKISNSGAFNKCTPYNSDDYPLGNDGGFTSRNETVKEIETAPKFWSTSGLSGGQFLDKRDVRKNDLVILDFYE